MNIKNYDIIMTVRLEWKISFVNGAAKWLGEAIAYMLAKEGSKVDFDKVLLMDNAGKVNVGAPVIKGAKITAKVLEHLKGDKVVVFNKKRRKGYKLFNSIC